VARNYVDAIRFGRVDRYLANSAMGAAPLIALFLLAQRYLVGGISLSGMKT